MWTRAINVRRVSVAALVSILFLLAGVVGNGPVGDVEAQTASADYFLKIEGIEGESIDDEHRGEIEVLSWSFGATNSVSAPPSGMSAGKVKMADFTIMKKEDKSTPKLFLGAASGKIIPSMTLTGGTDGRTFVIWELRNVIVTGFETRVGEGSGTPTDEVRFKSGQIIVSHVTQNSDGTTSVTRAGWDVIANKKV